MATVTKQKNTTRPVKMANCRTAGIWGVAPGVVWRGGGLHQEWYGGGEGCVRSGMEGGRGASGVVWKGGGVRQEWYGGGEGCARSGMEGGYREEERGKREYELWRCTQVKLPVHTVLYMYRYTCFFTALASLVTIWSLGPHGKYIDTFLLAPMLFVSIFSPLKNLYTHFSVSEYTHV